MSSFSPIDGLELWQLMQFALAEGTLTSEMMGADWARFSLRG